MSVEQAKAFIERMKTDEAFREKIMAIETPEERLKAIAAAGYDCTGEEINEVLGASLNISAGGNTLKERIAGLCQDPLYNFTYLYIINHPDSQC